jgi:hypothetical protein
MVVLSPLRKQGDVSRIPAAPPAVLLQGSDTFPTTTLSRTHGSSTSPTATLSRTQGSSTSPTATLACTQGSGTSLPDTLAHSYTPRCTPGPSPCIYKREVQGLPAGGGGGRAEGRANEQAHSLSLSLSRARANACNPYYEHHLVRDNTSRVSLLCSILRQPIWAGAHSDKIHWSAQLRVPRGPKRRQLARQVRAYCVLTNNFSLSSKWVVFSNLFSPRRCSASGVSSSCPSTAATTWYSSPRSATATTTVVSSPGCGELNDVFLPWRKSSIRVCPATLLAAGGGDGATVARQEAAPRRLSSESTTPAPQRGTCRALSSHLRQRRMSFPRNVPTPSGLMTPALS